MAYWALQYSDRVDVAAPGDVRNDVIEKIRNLYFTDFESAALISNSWLSVPEKHE